MTQKTKDVILMLILGIALIMVCAYFMRNCNRVSVSERDTINLVNSLNDSVKYYKDKDSISIASISVIQTTNTDLFEALDVKDSQIEGLKDEVDKYKSKLKSAGTSVSTIGTSTTIRSTTPTDGITDSDVTMGRYPTLSTDTSQYFNWHNYYYPQYTDTVSNKWLSYTILANSKEVSLKLKIVNDYTVLIGKDKRGTFAEVSNKNPYDSVVTLRTYQVKQPKEKRWGLGISGGAGFSTDFKPRPYIGLGVNYNLFKW